VLYADRKDLSSLEKIAAGLSGGAISTLVVKSKLLFLFLYSS
jgi:hypothetical protein